MADQIRPGSEYNANPRKFKDLGDGSFAEIVALESGSIGGGGADPTVLEDTPSVSGEKLIMAGVVRKDAAASLVDTDGDRTELQVDNTGALRVVSTGAAGGGLTDVQLRATPVPVTTQAVVHVDDNAGSLTVDGTVTVQDGGGAISVDDNGGSLTVDGPLTDGQLRAVPVPVSGTVTASGPLTDAQLRASAVPVSGPLTDAQIRATPIAVTIPTPTPVSDNAGSLTVDAPVATPVAVRMSDGAAFFDPRDVSDRAARLVGVVSGAANVFHVDDNAASLTVDAPVGTPVWVRLSDGAAAFVGQKVMASSIPVVIASDQSAVTTTSSKPSTGTRSSVAGAITDTLLLASNAARLGATIANDAATILFIGLGTTAVSATNYTAKLNQDDYYEIPAGFTGQIRGIWSVATGNARITELT